MPIYTYLIKIWPKVYSPTIIRNAKKAEFSKFKEFFESMYEKDAESHGILSYKFFIKYPYLNVIFAVEEKLPENDDSGDFIGFIVDPDRAGNNPVEETSDGKTFYGGFIQGFPKLISEED